MESQQPDEEGWMMYATNGRTDWKQSLSGLIDTFLIRRGKLKSHKDKIWMIKWVYVENKKINHVLAQQKLSQKQKHVLTF